jgi:hypothetical protein
MAAVDGLTESGRPEWTGLESGCVKGTMVGD